MAVYVVFRHDVGPHERYSSDPPEGVKLIQRLFTRHNVNAIVEQGNVVHILDVGEDGVAVETLRKAEEVEF